MEPVTVEIKDDLEHLLRISLRGRDLWYPAKGAAKLTVRCEQHARFRWLDHHYCLDGVGRQHPDHLYRCLACHQGYACRCGRRLDWLCRRSGGGWMALGREADSSRWAFRGGAASCGGIS